MQRIFISSVQKELAAERRALKDYIHGDPLLRRFFEVFLFEDLPAADRRVDEVYLAEVDRCSIYLALFGDDYGYEDAAGISPTEHEFNRATAAGKMRLFYVKGADDARRHPKMRALLRRACAERLRRRFLGIADLDAAVYASLVDFLAETGRVRHVPFDAAACPGADVSDLAPALLDRFLARAQATRGYALGPGTPPAAALEHLNLLDRDTPTHAAILLFAQDPQRWLPTSAVKCLHFHGTEVRKPIPSHQVYRGTVFALVDQAVDFAMSKVARAVGTRAEGNAAPVAYELPREAVAEAIVNAIAHRDYTSHGSVQVMLFADRLEVWNPGELPAALTPERLARPHASIPHNPLLADPLFLAGYIEQAGTGTLDMIARCREAGLRLPEFRQDGGSFVQTLWRPASIPPAAGEATPTGAPRDLLVAGQVTGQVAGQVTGQVTAPLTAQVSREIARLLRNLDGELTRLELQERLDLKGRANFEERYLKPALEQAWVEFTVPDKPQSRLQKYRLTAKGRAWIEARAKAEKP